MTISNLAATQRADHSQLSRALRQMRQKGLVSMRQAAQDGRQTIVTLTDKGRDVYQFAEDCCINFHRSKVMLTC